MLDRANINALPDLWRLMRPRQWAKNIFVFFGLLFSLVEPDASLVLMVCLAAVVFSLGASGVYVLNDLTDRESDRNHPKKRSRPLAAGTVSVGAATQLLAGLWLVAFVLAYLVSPIMVVLLAVYVVLNLGYSYGLKHVIYVDVAVLAAGYVLRVLAGTLAVGNSPTGWLLFSTTALALFLGFTKRRVELAKFLSDGASYRRVLQHYSLTTLNRAVWLSALSTALSYTLYTMTPEVRQAHGWWDLALTAPFVICGVGRYLFLQYGRQKGDDPTGDILRDPYMVVSVFGWMTARMWLVF
jgi:4-hydroxybenzoate polyprenyltransferase